MSQGTSKKSEPINCPYCPTTVTIAEIDGYWRVKLAIRDGKTARTREAKKRGRSIVRGGAGIANRAIALLSKMFACSEDWGLREGNPAQKIRDCS